MRRVIIPMLVTVGLLAVASDSAVASRAVAPTIKLRKTHIGTILVNGGGFTLYAFSLDRKNHDACIDQPDCLRLWPALVSSRVPKLGPGVRRQLVGTIKLRNGTRQATYAGHPLYTYIYDSGPGDTEFVNYFQNGGYWPAVNAAGREVK